ncbi:MAG: NUDIX domain-containing protein [Clostridium sp.]
MKTIHVVAAVIEAVDEQGKEILFATQRGYGDMKGGWEFSGGKIEPGETPQRHSNEKYRKNLIPKSRWEVLLIH